MLWRAKLPVGLWFKPQGQPLRMVIISSAAALLLFVLLLWFGVAVISGAPFDIPLIFIFAYLVLIMRAAALSRFGDTAAD